MFSINCIKRTLWNEDGENRSSENYPVYKNGSLSFSNHHHRHVILKVGQALISVQRDMRRGGNRDHGKENGWTGWTHYICNSFTAAKESEQAPTSSETFNIYTPRNGGGEDGQSSLTTARMDGWTDYVCMEENEW